MASASLKGPMGREIHFNEDAYPYWKKQFTADERQRMIVDDVVASESIITEMMCVIGTGVLLAIGSVVVCLLQT